MYPDLAKKSLMPKFVFWSIDGQKEKALTCATIRAEQGSIKAEFSQNSESTRSFFHSTTVHWPLCTLASSPLQGLESGQAKDGALQLFFQEAVGPN